MQKQLLSEMLKQNQFTSSFSLGRVTEENASLRLNGNTASIGFIYRHIGETINLFGQFLGVPTDASNTTIGQVDSTGWGGRLADAMQGCNTSGFPTIVSVGGNALFATGTQTNPATVTAGQVLGLQGFSTSAASQARLAAVQNLLNFDNGLTLVQASNAIGSSGLSQATALNKALAGGTPLKTAFPNTSLGTQLAQIAKIINVRATLGVNRQIFFAYLGGFDTHDLFSVTR